MGVGASDGSEDRTGDGCDTRGSVALRIEAGPAQWGVRACVRTNLTAGRDVERRGGGEQYRVAGLDADQVHAAVERREAHQRHSTAHLIGM